MGWQYRFPWFPSRDIRLARFRQILLAAQRTRYYQAALQRAGLAAPRAISRLSSVEEALEKLPYMDWAEFSASPIDFLNPTAPTPEPQHLRYPTAHEIRTAVLGAQLVETDSVRCFDPTWTGSLRQFRPEAIAGPVRVLMELAETMRDNHDVIPTLTRAIVAFTGLEQGSLSESERDMLWQVFQVPIFEQCLATDGSLLAWECEAHDGLHIVEENAIIEQRSQCEVILTSLTDRRYPAIRLATGLAAKLSSKPCECTQPGPRLIGLSTRYNARPRSAFAALSSGG